MTPRGTGRIGPDRSLSFTTGDVTVYGSLRAPVDHSNPVPAAVLVAGSGPVDRDGNATIGPYAGIALDCLRWLADVLADAGVASLRYDKLGVGATGPATFGSSELAGRSFQDSCVQPARDALACLADQPGIDPARLLVVGHSEGGGIALAVGGDAGDAPLPAGLALIEPMYERALDTLARQLVDQLRSSDLDRRTGEALVAWIDAGVRDIRDGSPPFPDPGPPPVPDARGFAATAQDVIAEAVYARFRNLLGKTEDEIDPAALAATIEVPVLLTAGAKDFNTPVDEDGRGVGVLARAFSPGIAELVVVEDLHHSLRDIGDADQMTSDADATAYPFSTQLAGALDAFVARFTDDATP